MVLELERKVELGALIQLEFVLRLQTVCYMDLKLRREMQSCHLVLGKPSVMKPWSRCESRP